MICLYLQPIYLNEDLGFRRLMNHLEPRYSFQAGKPLEKKYSLNFMAKSLLM